MTFAAFLECPALQALGVEHGLGTRNSAGVEIADLARAVQVHGTSLIEVPPLAPERRADALWTRAPGVAVCVKTADCVPILLADVRGRAVAAVHAGWRGSASGIAQSTVQQLSAALEASSDDFVGVIGPHIGPCCYEVDAPVRNAIKREEVFRPGASPGHYQLDLFELNRFQLLESGLRSDRIFRVGGCTACDPRLYASYRREGAGSSMLHFVRMPPSTT